MALLAGFLLLQQPWRALRGHRGVRSVDRVRARDRGDDRDLLAVDRVGTRLIDPLPYAAILWVTASIVLVVWVRVVSGGEVFAGGREQVRRAAIGGWLTLVAYLLILWALSVAPLSAVAPLRESATVFAAAWGSVRLGEAVEPRRDAVAGGCVVPDRGRGDAARARRAVGTGPRARAGCRRRGAAPTPLRRLRRREQPAPAPAPLTSATPGDDQGGPEDQRRIDRFLEHEVAEHDADDRQQVGDERRPRRAPVGEQPEVRRGRPPPTRGCRAR